MRLLVLIKGWRNMGTSRDARDVIRHSAIGSFYSFVQKEKPLGKNFNYQEV
ncbi:hypothetical protein [Halanaerocella petrolearia]